MDARTALRQLVADAIADGYLDPIRLTPVTDPLNKLDHQGPQLFVTAPLKQARPRQRLHQKVVARA